MADDATTEIDDLAPDDLDTIAGGTGHLNVTDAGSLQIHAGTATEAQSLQ